MLTHKHLLELLDYDPKTGVFVWKPRPIRPATSRTDKSWNGRYAGKQAGCVERRGYIFFGIGGKTYTGHRLAWFYVHGEWPDGDLDHHDTVKSHNWISNLRPATASQNGANRFAQANNTSGFKGVGWHKVVSRWRAVIKHRGKYIHIGHFDTPEEASAAYLAKARELWGDFARAA